MAGYLGTKAVLLSTTAANVTGNATIGGDLTVDTNTLYVDSTNNNVGIGNSSPSSFPSAAKDLVIGNTTGSHGITIQSQNISNGNIYFTDTTSTSYNGFVRYYHGDNALAFGTNDGTERMRIDSSGNLLVGTTDTNPTSNNVDGTAALTGGGIRVSRTGEAAGFNRKGSDGVIVDLRKDGITVGSIGAINGDAYIVTNNTGLRFYDAGNSVFPINANGASRDNAIDMGFSSVRFDDIYATNGTIQTSDRNEKQQIAALADAEMTAAKAISKLFKTFKWNDSVTEKGDAARTHTGVIAQEVEQAMTDAGLNAGDYAFFISSDWVDEETGEERNRKGIRYPQLLSFIGAATEQRLASIEARLDALEAV